MACEHELFIIETEWVSEKEVSITMGCKFCDAKFKGILE